MKKKLRGSFSLKPTQQKQQFSVFQIQIHHKLRGTGRYVRSRQHPNTRISAQSIPFGKNEPKRFLPSRTFLKQT